MVKINRKNIGVLLFIIITTLVFCKEKIYYSKTSDEVIYIENNIQTLEENLYFSFKDLPTSVSDEKQQDLTFIKEPKELKPVEAIKKEEKSKKLEKKINEVLKEEETFLLKKKIEEPKELKPVEAIKKEEKSKKLEEAEELKIKEVIEYAPPKKNKKIIFVIIIVFGGAIFLKKVIKRK